MQVATLHPCLALPPTERLTDGCAQHSAAQHSTSAPPIPDSVIPPVLTVETVADHVAIFASAYPQAHYSRMVKPALVEEDEAYSYNLTAEDEAWWITGWPNDY